MQQQKPQQHPTSNPNQQKPQQSSQQPSNPSEHPTQQLTPYQQQLQLSKNSKILFNLLQIRIFDISQSLQVSGHKLSINQIKQSLQKQYNIFFQTQQIFKQLKVNKLYEIIKQISSNYINITSILLDYLNKARKGEMLPNQSGDKFVNNMNNNKGVNFNVMSNLSHREIAKEKFEKIQSKLLDSVTNRSNITKLTKSIKKITYQQKHNQQNNQQLQQPLQPKTPILSPRSYLPSKRYNKFGGISIYNQSYQRGIEYPQKYSNSLFKGKNKRINHKQLLKQMILKQLNDQTDVQHLTQNDQVAKFIKQGKGKHQIYYHIEYEKDLESISHFLKQSQDQANKFLNQTKNLKHAQNDQKLVVNYHQLMEALTLKKNQDFKSVQVKLKQVIDKLKHQSNLFEDQLYKKQYQIQQLQRRLIKKQRKQYAAQTTESKNNLIQKSSSELTYQAEQHRIVVETLKKNLQENQKQLLSMTTEIKIIQEKTKKKQIENIIHIQQIQKLRKSLREEKQKFQAKLAKILKGQLQNLQVQVQQPHESDSNKDNIIQNNDQQTDLQPHRKKRNRASIMRPSGQNFVKPQNLRSQFSISNINDDHNNYSSSISDNRRMEKRANTINTHTNISQNIHNSNSEYMTNKIGKSESDQYDKKKKSTKYISSKKNLTHEQHEHHNNNRHFHNQNKPQIHYHNPSQHSEPSSSQKHSSTSSIPSKSLFSTIVSKNAQILYYYLFNGQQQPQPISLSSNRHQQIQIIKHIIQRFDQIKLSSKLKKIKTFFAEIQGLGYIKEQSYHNSKEQSETDSKCLGNTNNHHYQQNYLHQYEDNWGNQSNYMQNHYQTNRSKISHKNIMFEDQVMDDKNSFNSNNKNNRQHSSKKNIKTANSRYNNNPTTTTIKIDNNNPKPLDPNSPFFTNKQTLQHQYQSYTSSDHSNLNNPSQSQQIHISKIPSKQYLNKLHQKLNNIGIINKNCSKEEFVQMCRLIQINQNFYQDGEYNGDYDQEGVRNGKYSQRLKDKLQKGLNTLKYKNDMLEKYNSNTTTIQSGQQYDKSNKSHNLIKNQQNQQNSSSHQQKIIKITNAQRKLSQFINSTDNSPNSQLRQVLSKSQQQKLLKQLNLLMNNRSAKSMLLFKDLLSSNQLQFSDILQIKQMLMNFKDDEIEKMLMGNNNQQCHHHNHKQKSTSFSSQNQCCSHTNKYKLFIQKLIQKNSTKNKKQLFGINVCNIDGQSTQHNFHNVTKIKHVESPASTIQIRKRISEKNSIHQAAQDNYNIYSNTNGNTNVYLNLRLPRKSDNSLDTKSKLKKQVVSVYVENKQKKIQSLLPQLTKKGIRT